MKARWMIFLAGVAAMTASEYPVHAQEAPTGVERALVAGKGAQTSPDLAWNGRGFDFSWADGPFAYLQFLNAEGIPQWSAPVRVGARPVLLAAIPDGVVASSGGSLYSFDEMGRPRWGAPVSLTTGSVTALRWDGVSGVFAATAPACKLHRVDGRGTIQWSVTAGCMDNTRLLRTTGPTGSEAVVFALRPIATGGSEVGADRYDARGRRIVQRPPEDPGGYLRLPPLRPGYPTTIFAETFADTVSLVGLPDRYGGVIAVWTEYRRNPKELDLYVQGVTRVGYPAWLPTNGVEIHRNVEPALRAVPSAYRGAIIFSKRRVDLGRRYGPERLYAFHMAITGLPRDWPAGGIDVEPNPTCYLGSSSTFEAVPDGLGGAVVTWHTGGCEDAPEPGVPTSCIGLQWITIGASARWPDGGVRLGRCGGFSPNAKLGISPGRVLVVWEDERSGYRDIYGWTAPVPGLVAPDAPLLPPATVPAVQIPPVERPSSAPHSIRPKTAVKKLTEGTPTASSGAPVGKAETFNIIGAERPNDAILAYDVEGMAQVDRENSSADFWLKSSDSRTAGSNFSIEALNGALLAPKHVGQPPDLVPESAFVTFGGDVRQDEPIPCKTSSGRLCSVSAHYELSAGGREVMVTITLY